MSEGQRLLRARPESYGELAVLLGTNKGTVHRWATGEKCPGPAARAQLEEKLGIPRLAWSQVARDQEPQPAPPAASEPPAPSAAALAREAASATTLAELSRVLEKIQQIDTSDMLPGERARIFDSETKVLALIYKIQQDERRAAAELEHQLCQSQPFRALVRALVNALRPYPDAMRAAVRAIEETTGTKAA